jgi:hypothetical protein
MRHDGRWRRLINLSAESKGSIHDDEAAQALGFEGAFVPGSTVGTVAFQGIAAVLGPRWFEGGWYNLKFVTPVYTKNDVREEAEAGADGRVDVKVVTSEGRLCCSGQAGLGFEVPWDPAMNGKLGGDVALPGVELGMQYDAAEMRIVFKAEPDPRGDAPPRWASVSAMLNAASDTTGWFESESPFGRPLVAPESLHNFALRVTRGKRLSISGVRNPGMWAEHTLAIKQPLFLDEPYTMREFVADKGISGRTAFLAYEFEVLSGDEVLAVGRHKVKWLRE